VISKISELHFVSPNPQIHILLFYSSLLSSGYQGLFPLGVKRQGRESDHLPPSSAEVKE